MTFELDDALLQKILFAMENQTEKSAIDARNSAVISYDGQPNESEFYALPEWSSADGFSLLEEFAFNLRSPLAAEELKDVLRSGRGVFRNFKKAVRQYPEVERKWHLFKNKKMTARVYQWYNSLRESWGLELLDIDSIEIAETEDLVQTDFVFRPYNSSVDRVQILDAIMRISDEQGAEIAGLPIAYRAINRQHFEYSRPENESGIVCRSLSDELAGCVIFAPCGDFGGEAGKIVSVTAFFVQKEFRGLGIAKELLTRFFAQLKTSGARLAVFAGAVASDEMKELFIMFGLKKIGFGYAVDLSE